LGGRLSGSLKQSVVLKRLKKEQINGKFNNISSADENINITAVISSSVRS
jgi:hypothetical protein